MGCDRRGRASVTYFDSAAHRGQGLPVGGTANAPGRSVLYNPGPGQELAHLCAIRPAGADCHGAVWRRAEVNESRRWRGGSGGSDRRDQGGSGAYRDSPQRLDQFKRSGDFDFQRRTDSLAIAERRLCGFRAVCAGANRRR